MRNLYGFFTDQYYAVKDSGYIVIPDGADYKTNAISTMIYPDIDQCEVDLYTYQSDLVAENNKDRVAFFKEYILNETPEKIEELNKDYVIGIQYALYNKDGNIISSGESSTIAKYCMALINDDVTVENDLSYRGAFVFDGRIEINVPPIAKYGIKNAAIQYPYTLEIKKVFVIGTIGEDSYIKEANSQVNKGIESTSMQYFCHKPTDLSYNNFSSHFLTNAPCGSTVIDNVVVSKVLDTEKEDYVEVTMATVNLTDVKYAVKINNKLNLIAINVELLLDNYLEVYSREDINSVVEVANATDDESDNEDNLGDTDDASYTDTSKDLSETTSESGITNNTVTGESGEDSEKISD
jgi:hypothetical protein